MFVAGHLLFQNARPHPTVRRYVSILKRGTSVSRRSVLGAVSLLCALAACLTTPGSAKAGDLKTTPVKQVLELFTSQGCTSCLPADRILSRLSQEPDVLVLSYHVDYWDYIGWRDTLGSSANTQRQRDYARAFNTSTLYTPQIVVNGRDDAVGSHEDEIRQLMKTLPMTGHDADIRLSVVGDRLHIRADAGSVPVNGSMPVLLLVTFDGKTSINVDRGENSGHTLVSTHAVRDWRVLGMFSGEPMDVDMPMALLDRSDAHGDPGAGCAAILQSVTPDGAPGPILAATQLQFQKR